MLKLNDRVLVENISGIGPVFADEMSKLGYIHAVDLLASEESQLIATLSKIDGLSEFNLEHSILPQARMLRLPHCTEAIADALVEAAYHRYSDFLSVNISNIHTIVSDALGEEKNNSNLILAHEMLLTAVQLAVTSSARVVVYDSETNAVIEDAEVVINGDRRTNSFNQLKHMTDNNGVVDFEGIAPLPTVFKATAAGYKTSSFLGTLRPQSHHIYNIYLKAGTESLPQFNEFLGGFAIGHTILPSVRRTVDLDSLPEKPPICIEAIKTDEAIAGSLWFKHQDDTVIIYRLRIDLSLLPNDIAHGDVLLPNESGWQIHPEAMTPGQYRETLREQRMPVPQGGTL
ncbi:hypothetical protein [Thalassotalea atypica]|uniref:hypothetical protein n=1 Tax=Thalassotalea atypica TaxID=2054316 RepID=UPI002572BBDA|nr:hypothetical protein [Thalassotalea atypica]